MSPTVRLTGGPPEGDTTSYKIKFSWMGNDPDGTVEHYEYAMCDGSPGGFDPADTTGLDAWTKIDCTDSTFAFSASETGEEVIAGVNKKSSYCRTVHTFFIRAVDDKGMRSIAAYRSFTASTLSPFAVIKTPVNPFLGREQQLPSLVRFTWEGHDPIDDPWNVQEPESIRYFLALHSTNIIDNLNRNPEDFESRWCPWLPYHAPGDSGTSTVIGDDEILARGFGYIFAVQAKDEAGAVTSVFDPSQNVRIFRVFNPPGPLLSVRERNLGSYTFIGGKNRTETFRVPGGFTLDFSWTADASSYGAVISSYRYGWDIADLNDPNEWDVVPSPLVKTAALISFRTGVHTLFIEALDNMGTSTLAQFELTIFPMKMMRNLLWVDDFYSTDFPQIYYAFPTETEHKDFWLGICGRARDFEPGSDVYVTANMSFREPDIEVLWKYKNIIWTFSAGDDVMAWDDMVRFTPESLISPTRSAKFNYLAYYVSAGGHIWTEGRSDSRGRSRGGALDHQSIVPPESAVRDRGNKHRVRRRHERRLQHRVPDLLRDRYRQSQARSASRSPDARSTHRLRRHGIRLQGRPRGVRDGAPRSARQAHALGAGHEGRDVLRSQGAGIHLRGDVQSDLLDENDQ